MYQSGSPNREPSQTAALPDKPVAGRPGEPRKSRAKTSVLVALSVYHYLRNVSLMWSASALLSLFTAISDVQKVMKRPVITPLGATR